jgi:hypothetical protein
MPLSGWGMSQVLLPFRGRAFPTLADACEELRRLSQGGHPVVLLDVDQLSREEAEAFLDLWLHDPSMAAPLEPFAGILSALVHRRALGLWDLPHLHVPGADAVVETLPADHPECLSCACFPICEGYAAGKGSCETWRAVIARLASSARELAMLRRPQARVPLKDDAR